MSEIKEGNYIRTQDGKIGIFMRYSLRPETSLYKSPFNCFIKLQGRKTNLQCHRSYIRNHSKDIIDLIELGDYVNGYKVVKANLESKEYGKYVDVYCPSQNLKLEFLEHVFNEQIKSIVTKEQFAQIEYKVKE